jgi:putative transposase
VRDGFYKGYRFPIEIIRHCVWPYYRFSISLRDVSEMMAYRGIAVSQETVREWGLDFAMEYANKIRHNKPKPGSTWHLDEVFLKINGKQVYLWRAVDEHGEELDILVTKRRDKKAAKRFLKKLLANLEYTPKRLVTDKLRSYAAAKSETMPDVPHIQDKGANMRAENSHRHVRKRERHLQRFKSLVHARRFLPAYCQIRCFFSRRRHLYSAHDYRELLSNKFNAWNEMSNFKNVA